MDIEVQYACEADYLPTKTELLQWLQSVMVFITIPANSELVIRLVSTDEIQQLNHQYRQQPKPTNVLSFPMEMPDYIDAESNYLGDIVICAEIISKESQQQQKLALAHWAHITIHGLLHLLGYDHQSTEDANVMENLEIQALKQLGYPNPYETTI